MGFLVKKKKLSLILKIILILCFLFNVPVLLLWHLPLMQPDSHLHASETPCRLLRAHCRSRGHRRLLLKPVIMGSALGEVIGVT